jgi:hypothetical protein
VDGLAGQHDTDTSEMIIRWMVGWFAGVSVAVGWSRSDGRGRMVTVGIVLGVERSTASAGLGWSGWSDSNHCARPTLTYLRSSWGIQLGCSSSVRAWSIWSLGVRRHGGRGHRLTLVGERFVGLAPEDAAAYSIFFPMD